jgi:hypothetical protein
MPGFLTDVVNNNVLDCLFGGSPIIPPSTLFIGLSLARSYKGGYVSEPTGGSYARVAVPNDLSHFSVASSGGKSNAKAITFPSPSAAWGPILSVFVADAFSEGNVLAMADLTAPKLIRAGDPAPTISVNALFLSHT